MKLEYMPLLGVQRDLYRIPRGSERFREYIRTMTDADSGDLRIPLVAMNPMGKDHVPALVDELLAVDADRAAAEAVAAVAPSLSDVAGEFKVSLVVADDLKGGWTNRYASEFTNRFEVRAMTRRGFIVGLLWTSEPASAEAAREAALMAVFRTAHIERHGTAVALGEMLEQEGYVAAMAGCSKPALEPEDLEYTREVVTRLRGAKDRATIFACLFGDRGACDLGYPPQGLSARAGFALALADGRAGSAAQHSRPLA